MKSRPSPLRQIEESLGFYQEGDILQLAEWVRKLTALRTAESSPEVCDTLDVMVGLVRQAMSAQAPDDFVPRFQGLLDRILGGPAPQLPEASGAVPKANPFWDTHGPAFLSETRTRLARAQELILGMEAHPSPDDLGELFRIFHSIKGEAGFLGRSDVVTHVHGTEGYLDDLRSGVRFWDPGSPDILLTAIDELGRVLGPTGSTGPGASVAEAGAGEILRIPASKIDGLTSLIGELLIALENGSHAPTPAVRKAIRGIQHSALQLRTESLHDLFGRIHRGARDLGRQLGKPIEVRLAGEDLELDRLLITMLEEPLMHLVRNALDHGIETAAVRGERGKSPVGRFELAARRKGNRIEILVGDDGNGLDPVKIWTKALHLGMAEGDLPEDVSLVYDLIFRPGFSTADGVTQVSGRGVGMEIVAKTVQKHQGQVRVDSTPGQGTRVTLSFPLSTAVLEGLVVRLENRRFIVPIHSARESLRVRPADLSPAGPGSVVYSLRGTPIPVFTLRRFLGLPEPGGVGGWGVVLEPPDGKQVLMIVDEVEAKREVVIRSLGVLFRGLRGVSAATVLQGDRLALVLDPDQIVQQMDGQPW